MNLEGVGDQLRIAARCEPVGRALERHTGFGGAAELRECAARRRGDLVVADHPADLLDQILLDGYVESKRGGRDTPAVGFPLYSHLETLEHAADTRICYREPEHRAHARSP